MKSKIIYLCTKIDGILFKMEPNDFSLDDLTDLKAILSFLNTELNKNKK